MLPMRNVKVSEIINDRRYSVEDDYGVEIVSRTDKVCTMFGLGALELTEERIEALRSGKCLYFTDGEYAHLLYMKREGDPDA